LSAEAQFLRGLVEKLSDLIDFEALAMQRMGEYHSRR
jgi:hypothetical protein